jgi:putative hydrolase of the HAD superfamily
VLQAPEPVAVPPLPRPPRVVFLDAGDTLLAPHPSFARRFVMVAEAAGERFDRASVEAALADEARQAAWPVEGTDPATQRTFWEGFYDGVLVRLGHDADRDELVAALYATFSDPATYRLFPDARPAMDALRADGIRLGLISNFEPWLAEVLELEGVRHLFEVEAISGVLGVAKPDPAIFETALSRAGVAPGDAVHVGDSPTLDVQAAWAVGMAAVLVDRSGSAGDTRAPRLPDLAGLPALLRRAA